MEYTKTCLNKIYNKMFREGHVEIKQKEHKNKKTGIDSIDKEENIVKQIGKALSYM